MGKKLGMSSRARVRRIFLYALIVIKLLVMDGIEDKVKQALHQKLFILEYSKRNPYVTEWKEIRKVVDSLIPTITGLLNEEREETRKLQAELNQLSFGNDPARDQQIIVLSKQGLPKAQIARIVEMSRQGLYKALRRLGVNSVNSVVTD